MMPCRGKLYGGFFNYPGRWPLFMDFFIKKLKKKNILFQFLWINISKPRIRKY